MSHVNKNDVPAFNVDFGGNVLSDTMNDPTTATIENGCVVYYSCLLLIAGLSCCSMQLLLFGCQIYFHKVGFLGSLTSYYIVWCYGNHGDARA